MTNSCPGIDAPVRSVQDRAQLPGMSQEQATGDLMLLGALTMSRFILVACAVLAFSFGVAKGGGPAPEKVRAQIFELTNEFRKSEKMEPLKLNDKLGAAAQKHAENLARRDKFGDDGKDGYILDGENGKPRIEREGYQIAAWAENVLQGASVP